MKEMVLVALAGLSLTMAITLDDCECHRASVIFAGLVPVLTVAAAKCAVKDDADEDADEDAEEEDAEDTEEGDAK